MILDASTPLPDAVLRYAEHDEAYVDVHLPPTGTSAAALLLVLLHGGFWKTAYDRRHTRPMAAALAEAGFVVATPEYRRVGPGGSGGWPATGDDVRRATERLPGLLAGLGVTTTRTLATGHSAGGHLALWLATTGLPLERVVALAPVCDLREAIRLGLGSEAARAFLGEVDPAACDPMTLLDDRPQAEITVVHGTEDDVVPVSLARGLVDRHPWVRLVEVPDAGHFEVIDPADPAFAAVVAELRL